MSAQFPPEIRNGLLSLRRRIRRIRLFRGLLRLAGVALVGLLVIVALDFLLAPLPSLARAVLFYGWLAAMAVAAVVFLILPLMSPLPLVRLARWLEERHPELQERISTTLELAGHPEGISPALLEELSEEAAADMTSLDPHQEVQTRRVRASMWPALSSLAAMVVLLVIWPQEMGRLLTRAVLPFSELGNAGAFRFEVAPGDLEVLEGDEFTLDLTYTGELKGPLELIMDRNGERVVEELTPDSSDDRTYHYRYTVHSAAEGFQYSARVARDESDRFEVKVYPIPRLLEPVVGLTFPDYTGWPDRELALGMGIQALAGTKVTVRGRLDTPVTGGEVVFGENSFGELGLERNARGTLVEWVETLQPGQDGSAVMNVTHQLGRDFEAARFALAATEDPAPEVRILTPLERKFQVQPNDQVIITYAVIEEIGIDRAEIELEINGKPVESLSEVRPERVNLENGNRWEGEAMVYLGSLVSKYPEAAHVRLRLKVSDNRPSELAGPGVGFSEWLEFKLNRGAESLARQKLRNQDADLKKTIDEVVRKVQNAQNRMHEAKGHLRHEEVTRQAEEALAATRDTLKEARSELADLSERMAESVQAHRRDEVARASEKLAEAQKAIENAPLQDSPEARQDEVDRARAESEDAIRDLQNLKQEVEEDRGKIEDLARLQEMAQRQDELARQAEQGERNENWQQQQEQLRDELLNRVKESPEAKAAALRAQAEEALELAKEAGELQQAQEKLAELSGQVGQTPVELDENQVREALANEQEKVAAEARQELNEARRDDEQERARDLLEAVAESQQAARQTKEANVEEAARKAEMAAEDLERRADESPTQKSLAEKQEKLAEALRDLSEGNLDEARSAVAELQNNPTLRELGNELAAEQEMALNQAREELQQARDQQDERAADLPAAVEKANEALADARENQPEKAAEAASEAAEQLAKGEEESLSQESLRQKQEKLAEAFEALAEGDGEKAREALEEARNVPSPEGLAEALAQAQQDLQRGIEKAQEQASEAGEDARAESLAEAAQDAGKASQEAQSNDAESAAQAAKEAASELAEAAAGRPFQKSLQNQQESLAEAFEAFAEGDLEKAAEALEAAQAERLSNALEQALAREQEAIVEGARQELSDAREALEDRANHLPEALAQAQAALEQVKQGDLPAAAAAAESAASELVEGSEAAASQAGLQDRQEQLADALASLVEGDPAAALATLQQMQAERAEALAEAIQGTPPVEGNPLGEAGQQAEGGAQQAQQASQSQQAGQKAQASQQHQAAADQFAQAQQSLEGASAQMASQAQQAAQQGENPNNANAPGEPLADALQNSSQAAQAGQSGQQQSAAEKSRSAAQSLQQAANQAMSNMQQGNQPGDAMAQSDQPQPGEGKGESPPPDEAQEGVRQAQGDKGVPPELAKLGINTEDWEKIQATLKTDVSGARGAAIPEDYRGLVRKYFEQISKEK